MQDYSLEVSTVSSQIVSLLFFYKDAFGVN